jgi:hypothetical protein
LHIIKAYCEPVKGKAPGFSISVKDFKIILKNAADPFKEPILELLFD